jgi:glycosyltransferase involved in cell wall biosynthesis
MRSLIELIVARLLSLGQRLKLAMPGEVPLLSYFIVKADANDVEAFIHEIRAISNNGVILVLKYSGEIEMVQAPSGLSLKKVYRFYKPGHWSENRWIKWPCCVMQILRVMLKTAIYDKIDVVLLDGGDITAWFAKLLCAVGRVNSVYNLLLDWSLLQASSRWYERVNIYKLYLNDLLAMTLNIRTVVTTREVYEARHQFWKGRTRASSVLFENYWARQLEVKRSPSSDGKTIVFLGNVREQFGMDLLFAVLKDLNRQHGIRMRVIGPASSIYQEYRAKALELGLNELIDWRGYVPLEDLPAALADAFCGVNLREEPENCSSYAIAGRVVNFLQYQLVPVVTPQSGAIVTHIERHELGVICAPQAHDLSAAILTAFHHQVRYRERIVQFINSNPYRKPITDFVPIRSI